MNESFTLEQEDGAAIVPETGLSASLGSLAASCEDCMALMARYPDKHFDLAIVDPPYGIGATNNFNMKHIKSTDLDALDAAIAEKVAGWVPYVAPKSRGSIMLPYTHFDGNGFPQLGVLPFTRSADAVLPWLDNAIYWDSHFCDGQHRVFVNEMRRDVVNKGDYEGTAKTFPHAAAIALLRAHGVKVE